MLNTVEAASKIEETIIHYLWVMRVDYPWDYTVQMVALYDYVKKSTKDDVILTSGFFNRLISEMKKTGKIKTAEGGQIVFITDEYHRLHTEEATDRFTLTVTADGALVPLDKELFNANGEPCDHPWRNCACKPRAGVRP